MYVTRLGLLAATRAIVTAAALAAIAAIASVAAAQSTYQLKISPPFAGYFGTAQVTSTPAGIDCHTEPFGSVLPLGTCTAQFPAGTTVTLNATPLYGGTFDGWAGACAGQPATCQLTMTAALEASPKVIAKTYTLTVQGTGNANGRVASSDFLAQPAIRCIIGPGGVTSGTCVAEYPANQTARLGREEPLNYATFGGWTGCDAGPADCNVVMTGPRTVTAGWLAMEIIISPSPAMNGTGKVTGTATNHPIGSFDCTLTPTAATGVCSAKWQDFVPPMSVTLTATPTGNSVFVGWGPGCTGPGSGGNVCVIPLQLRPIQIRPLFDLPSHALYVLAAGSGSGAVVSAPTGINCTITKGATNQFCAGLFSNGTQVTLTADPTGGSTFGGWSGACSGNQSTCVVTVNATTQAIARFNAPRPAAELALALLTGTALSDAEARELDRFGNKDGAFNLGDLLALMSRTGERLSGATVTALLATQPRSALQRGNGRPQ